MSLYNALFGRNPASPILLSAIDVGGEEYPVPRFRDCYLKPSEHHGWMVVVHTRTGGGNRTCYCRDPYFHDEGEVAALPEGEHFDGCYPAMNRRLAQHPLYLYDQDDDFDTTYADFVFRLPEEFHPVAEALAGEQGTEPRERWQALFRALNDGDKENPDVARAMEVGEEILGKLNEALEGEGEKIIEV